MGRNITIRELASRLGLSISTLRKYHECGLLEADAARGHAKLYDEVAASARVRDIADLKERGILLGQMRTLLTGAPTRGLRPDLLQALNGVHSLLVVDSMPEYERFLRAFVNDGLARHQAVVVGTPPNLQAAVETTLAEGGLDLQPLQASGQFLYAWYVDPFSIDAQVEAIDAFYDQLMAGGWSGVRVIGYPSGGPVGDLPEEQAHEYERRVSEKMRGKKMTIVCVWLAAAHSAQKLLEVQRHHAEVVIGSRLFREV